MATERIHALLFGGSVAVLAAAWSRGLGQAFGGDALASHLVLGAFALAFAHGAFRRRLGGGWGTRAAGFTAALVAWFAPMFERAGSGIYHALGGGWAGASACAVLALLVAAQPGTGLGHGLARLLASGRADVAGPGLLGAACGLAALDLPPLGSPWGEGILVLAAIGATVPFRRRDDAASGASPAVGGTPVGPRRAALLVAAGLAAAAAVVAALPILVHAAQFHAGRRIDATAVLASVLLCAFVGSVAFGGLVEGRARVSAGFGFAGLAGVASIVSLLLVARLGDPRFLESYRRLFEERIGAREGTLRFDAVFACGLGSFFAFAAGAALRNQFAALGPACAGALAAGIGVGLFAAPALLPGGPSGGGLGLRDAAVGAGTTLAALGVLASLAAPGPALARGLCAAAVTAAAALALRSAPDTVRIANPASSKRVDLFLVQESIDGVAAAAGLVNGEPVVRRDRTIVANEGPSNRDAIGEVALSCALAPRLDRVLLVGIPSPRVVGALRRAGARSVEAAPASLGEGRCAQFFASRNEEKVGALHRAPAGLRGGYDLVFVLADPPFLARCGRGLAAGRLGAFASLASADGTVAVWVDAGTLDASGLGMVEGAAGASFDARFAVVRGVEGFSVGWVRGARLPEGARTTRGPLYREIGLLDADDAESLRIGARIEGTPRIARALGLWGCVPAFDRIGGAGWRRPDPSLRAPWLAWRPREDAAAAAATILAAACSGEPLRAVFRGLALHARAQRPDYAAEDALERIEVSGESIGEILRAAEAAPDSEPVARLVEAVGDLLLRKREYGEVYARFTRLVERVPGRSGFLRILGAAHLELVDPQGALALLDRAHRADPADLQVAILLARAMEESGDRPLARDLLASIEAERPDDVRVLVPLAQLLWDLGDPEGARTRLRRAEAVAPNDRSVHQLRARLGG